MQAFEFYCPTKIYFGKGAEAKVGEAVKHFGGTKVFIVYGGHSAVKSGLIARIEQTLTDAGLEHMSFGGVQPNPRLSHAREGVQKALAFGADFILGVGGGSVMDTSKAIAHGVANPETDIWDFWSKKAALTKTSKLGAVLTISAAGSETSDSAVLTNDETTLKRGLNTDLQRPLFAIMDPELTYTLPRYQVGCGVVDIMMHTLERYFNPGHPSNRMTDEIAEGLLRTVIDAGRVAMQDSHNYDAMSEIMWAGSLSHNNLTGLGGVKDFSVHQFGHELSGMFDAAHGATLSVMWPQWARCEALAEDGKTPLLFSENGRLLGVIAVADVIKPDSPQAVRELRNMGIEVVMLTGDNERTARAIGAAAGVDRVIAGVLPDGKEAEIRRLRERGKVAMVGDGINDAPALTRADVGIAIGAGADVALDAADVVLMKSRLSDVPAAIRLSRATLRNIHQNLFWAFFYNTLGIPLAAGVFVPLGLTLNPMFGAAAMSLSSFCVVSNALRLNLFKLRDPKHDHKHRKKPASANTAPAEEKTTTEKEKEPMKKTMKIEGMMCAHCEAAVKKALEAIPEVVDAEVSHTAGTAVVTLQSPVDDAALKKAVEDKDYKVLGIE